VAEARKIRGLKIRGYHINSLPVLPEVKRLKGKRMLCLQGSKENDSLCRKLDSSIAQSIVLQGGHHFGGDYEAISDIIVKELDVLHQTE
jgi:type IV secretory pathway VirJ component